MGGVMFRIGVFVVVFQCGIWAAVVGNIRGVVHDPEHRPVQGAEVAVKASSSDYVQKLTTDGDGGFEASGPARWSLRGDGEQGWLRTFSRRRL